MPDRNIPLDAQPGDGGDAEQAEAAEAPPAFENRAARRARGKGSANPPPASGKGQPAAGRGSVQGPRMWGNRRSG